MPFHGNMGFLSNIVDEIGRAFGGGTTGGGGPPEIDFNRLTTQGPFLLSLMDRVRFQEDPVRRGILQQQIDDSNFANRFNPNFARNVGEGVGPQFNLGNPIGDLLSGFGGAFGFDPLGNPLTPAGGLIQRTVGELGQGSNIATQGVDALNALGNLQGPNFQSGITGQSLDLGQRLSFPTQPTQANTTGINPDFQMRGIPQGGRPIPQPLPDLPQLGGTENAILEGLLRYIGIPSPEAPPPTSIREGQGRDPVEDPFSALGPPPGGFNVVEGQRVPSLAHGITSVPQDGLANLHEGEAIVPAELNPLAGTQPQPLTRVSSGGTFPTGATPVPRPSPVTPLAPPVAAPAPQPISGVDSIFAASRNLINDETAGLLRQNRNAAGALGSVNTGEFRGAQQDIQQGRINQLSDARFQAGQQFFGMNLDENRFAAERLDADRGFDFALQQRIDELNRQGQEREDQLFNLLLSLGFLSEQQGAIDPALSQQPTQPSIPLTLG